MKKRAKVTAKLMTGVKLKIPSNPADHSDDFTETHDTAAGW